jgi:hypothetical protein
MAGMVTTAGDDADLVDELAEERLRDEALWPS